MRQFLTVCSVVAAALVALPAPSQARRSAARAAAPAAKQRAQNKPAKPARAARTAGKRRVGKSRGGRRADRWPPMTVINPNSRERATLRIYDRRGRVDRSGVRRLQRLMRCLKTGRQRRIDWRLVQHIYRVSRAFPGKSIYIYSGYRHRRVARLRTSNHTLGRAVDLRVEGVSNRTLRDFLRRTFRRVGVGYYPNSLFVHLDVRAKRSAFWVDVSGPGEGARYIKDPYALLRAERRSRKSATMASAASGGGAGERVKSAGVAKAMSAGASGGESSRSLPQAPLVIGPAPVGPVPAPTAPRNERARLAN